MQNKLSKIFYALAIILAILFVVLIAIVFYDYRELLKNPYVLVVPFSTVVKWYALRLLVPAAVCAIVGYVLQRKNRDRTE